MTVGAPAAPAAPAPLAVAPPDTAEVGPTAPAAPAEPAAIGFVQPPAGAHYDPGEGYVNPLGEASEPEAPRCFGDYKPEEHMCSPCPALSGCQKKNLGVA